MKEVVGDERWGDVDAGLKQENGSRTAEEVRGGNSSNKP